MTIWKKIKIYGIIGKFIGQSGNQNFWSSDIFGKFFGQSGNKNIIQHATQTFEENLLYMETTSKKPQDKTYPTWLKPPTLI